MTAPGDRARQLASALNDVVARGDATRRRDPLRSLLMGESGSDWAAQIATIVASRGRVLEVDDYLATDDVDLHVIRLRDREVVERSPDGVWRAGGDDARHRIRSAIGAMSRSAVAWIAFSVFVAAVVAGLVVMFVHTATTAAH